MERLVMTKPEEMEDGVLAWDPDEYTEISRQKLKMRRVEKSKVDTG